MATNKSGTQPAQAQASGVPLLSITILVGLFALATDALHLQLGRIGWNDMIAPLMDPADERLRKTFSGIEPIDGFLKVIITVFEPVVLLDWPEISLYGFQFAGQAIAIITVFLVQGLRESNRGNVVRFGIFWGMCMQAVGFAVIIPLYYILDLALSSSKPQSAKLRDPAQLFTVIPAFGLGYMLPTILQVVPLERDVHQMFIVVWQFVPLYVGLLLPLFSGVFKRLSVGQSGAEEKSRFDRDALQSAYGFAIAMGALTQWITISTVIAAQLMPHLFPDGMAERLTFQSVFVPDVPHTYGPATIAEVSRHFLLYDQYVGSAAGLVWAVTKAARAGIFTGSIGDFREIIKDVIFLGPQSAVISLMWKTDEALLA